MISEEKRLAAHYNHSANWLKWGPYLSERQWGTVREDNGTGEDVWNGVSHDMARSTAYRWGEDGIAGFCDDRQLLCISLACWNGNDPIMKERLFGLTNLEGNHGEDVKELYYYLDGLPTHSYNKMLYKYPQEAFPYNRLVRENARRTRLDPEFELIDTGLFEGNHYFDIEAEYAKNDTDDILCRYTAHNRSSRNAELHLLPHIFFRNTWQGKVEKEPPLITYLGNNTLLLQHETLGEMFCYAEGEATFLFTNNETNNQRRYQTPNASPYCKDGIHNYVVYQNHHAVNPLQEGTRAAAWYQLSIPAGGSATIKLRLVNTKLPAPFDGFDQAFSQRIMEADAFYKKKQGAGFTSDLQQVQRQAWAGMLWSKQYYQYDVNQWRHRTNGKGQPVTGAGKKRNQEWKHFSAHNIMSMPDKWEYPWFAAWDLAFHTIAFAPIDPDFAKGQLKLLLQANYMHPNGQLPAYEWDFSDANPPVHALAAWKIFQIDRRLKGVGDHAFLASVFQKLVINFTWWVNRKDSNGNNIFEGGFLGLDNIGLFNRSEPVPGGGQLEQADGTSWMAMYALNMVQIALELSLHNPLYIDMAIKFSEHFLFIAGSITNMGEDDEGLWDDIDGFYYDMLKLPDGTSRRLRVRSMVGLIPMFATIIFNEKTWQQLPAFYQHMEKFSQQRPDLATLVSSWKDKKGDGEQHLFSLLRGHRLKLLLKRMLDPAEFLSPHGIRSVSAIYRDDPYQLHLNGVEYEIQYNPAESVTNMFGGNSNWRGPIWMPLNFLLIDALYNLHEYYSSDFRVEFPTHSGNYYSLAEIAGELSQRLYSLFTKNAEGDRAIFGEHPTFNNDPHFKDHLLFYEYFNGDTGKGLGAAHQTGWTGLIAVLDQLAVCNKTV